MLKYVVSLKSKGVLIQIELCKTILLFSVIHITKWVDSFIRTEIHLMDGKAKQSLQKQTLSENFPLINTTNSNPHVSSCYTLKPDFVDVILLSWV